jgi:hypothetical protein
MPLYKVTDIRDGLSYRIERDSKAQVKRTLTRFSPESGYWSFWKIEEVPFCKYRRLKDVPSHLYA